MAKTARPVYRGTGTSGILASRLVMFIRLRVACLVYTLRAKDKDALKKIGYEKWLEENWSHGM